MQSDMLFDTEASQSLPLLFEYTSQDSSSTALGRVPNRHRRGHNLTQPSYDDPVETSAERAWHRALDNDSVHVRVKRLESTLEHGLIDMRSAIDRLRQDLLARFHHEDRSAALGAAPESDIHHTLTFDNETDRLAYLLDQAADAEQINPDLAELARHVVQSDDGILSTAAARVLAQVDKALALSEIPRLMAGNVNPTRSTILAQALLVAQR